MNTFKCIDYSQLFLGTIEIDSLGHISSKIGRYNVRAVNKKTACICTNIRKWRASDWLRANASYCPMKASLYIVKGVRMARDLFRNSEYKITRSKENADRMVLPALPNNIFYLSYNVIFKNTLTDRLHIYSLRKDLYYPNNQLRNDFLLIKEYFENLYRGQNLQWFQDDLVTDGICEFLPTLEEYKSILTCKGSEQTPYIFEEKVPYKPPVTINLETLRVWKYCSDLELLGKTICNSDWKSYPACLCFFLYSTHRFINCRCSAQNLRFILQQIGYSNGVDINTMLSGRIIEPQDWNLLQDYIMDCLGVSENGGYIPEKKTEESDKFLKMIRVARAVAPRKINTPLLYENISQMLG